MLLLLRLKAIFEGPDDLVEELDLAAGVFELRIEFGVLGCQFRISLCQRIDLAP
jgi:hypothetical protein